MQSYDLRNTHTSCGGAPCHVVVQIYHVTETESDHTDRQDFLPG